jgi:hypothetical protein
MNPSYVLLLAFLMTTPILSCVEEVAAPKDATPESPTLTIRCYVFSSVATSPLVDLSLDRRLAARANDFTNAERRCSKAGAR